MKSLFNVGDTITVRTNWHDEFYPQDYPFGLYSQVMNDIGNKPGKITKVIKKEEECFRKLFIEPYGYQISIYGNPTYDNCTFSAMMFQECSCITPGRPFWDILWTRRYPDIIFDRIRKNLTVDIDKTSGLRGGFIFSNTLEGHKFWDTIDSADMKQLIECIAWLITEFPQDFYLINPTNFTNNLTINQNEDQLQRTEVNLGRDENQRGIICVYPENRPRVTIAPLSYTAIGYRNEIKIS